VNATQRTRWYITKVTFGSYCGSDLPAIIALDAPRHAWRGRAYRWGIRRLFALPSGCNRREQPFRCGFCHDPLNAPSACASGVVVVRFAGAYSEQADGSERVNRRSKSGHDAKLSAIAMRKATWLRCRGPCVRLCGTSLEGSGEPRRCRMLGRPWGMRGKRLRRKGLAHNVIVYNGLSTPTQNGVLDFHGL
jgi:hypothetical protein